MSTFVVLMRVVYISYDEKVFCKKHNLDNESHKCEVTETHAC